MPLYPRTLQQAPDYWWIGGHSYFKHSFGGRTIMGRPDAILRSALDIEWPNWQNWAVSGSRLSVEGYSQGGYARLFQAAIVGNQNKGWVSTTAGAPYVQYGGTKLLGWGLNDAGISGCTATTRSAYINTMRTCIALCRASRYFDTTSASFAYTSWTNSAFTQRDWSLTLAATRVAAATSALVTFTLPADYSGTPVTLLFIGYAGNNSVITFGGTAGVTGTLSLSGNVLASAFANHSPICKRITTLTAANAGQTITATVSTWDSVNGGLYFDGALIEAVDPGPVLLPNLNRLPSAAYAGVYATPTDGTVISDIQIAQWNVDLAALVAEFDSMVALVDFDSAIQSTGNPAELLATDNLHPNELGAAAIADACYNSVQRLTPTKKFVRTTQLNTPARRIGPEQGPKLSNQWYMSEATVLATSSFYTPVSGDMFAIPYREMQPDAVWLNWSVELVSSTVATTIRFGIYDDPAGIGYPQSIFNNLTSSAALSLTTGAGVKVSPLTGNGSFVAAIATPPEPGLYWLVVKFDTIGTSTVRVAAGPDPYLPKLTTTGAAMATGGPSCWKLTGQGTASLANTFPQGAALTDPCPLVGLKYT